MTSEHHHRSKTVRLTVDAPVCQQSKKKHKDATDEKFNKLLEEFLVEKAPMLERLAKK